MKKYIYIVILPEIVYDEFDSDPLEVLGAFTDEKKAAELQNKDEYRGSALVHEVELDEN